LKILYLHQHFTTREGSGGTRSYEFARMLRQRGHEITILCGKGDRSGLPSQSSRLIEERELEGLKILQLKVVYNQKMSYWRRMLSFAWFMLLASWVAVRQRDIDIIFATSTPLTIAVPAIIASRISQRPFVFEVRDLWPEVPIGLGVLRNPLLVALARGLERLSYRYATHIVACSPGMRDGILRAGVETRKVSVVPNACDNDLFDVPAEIGLAFRARHPHLKGRPLVVYAGAFGMANGLDYLVRLAQQVRSLDESVAFLLVGVGKEREAIYGLAQVAGVLHKTLWLMDAIPRESMPEVLSAATIAISTFVSNSVLWHNSANKFFDALAAGRPVAINYNGWQADLLKESGAGIILPPDDVEKAAVMLIEFLHSESLLGRARQAARLLARERFDRNQLANQLEGILLDTMSGLPVTNRGSCKEIIMRGRNDDRSIDPI
jgi:glycosyltransferase involved in cell wall biosynthesis